MLITTFSQLEENTQEKFIGAEASGDCWDVLAYLRNGLQDFAEGLGLNSNDVQIYSNKHDKWSGSVRYRTQSLIWIECTRCISHKKMGRYDSQKYAYKTIKFFPLISNVSIKEVFEAAVRITNNEQAKADEERAYIISLYKKIMADRNVNAYGAKALLDRANKIFYDIEDEEFE